MASGGSVSLAAWTLFQSRAVHSSTLPPRSGRPSDLTNRKSPVKAAASPTRYVVLPSVWPGVWNALITARPTVIVVPSSNSEILSLPGVPS